MRSLPADLTLAVVGHLEWVTFLAVNELLRLDRSAVPTAPWKSQLELELSSRFNWPD
jgi:hypothetical protein